MSDSALGDSSSRDQRLADILSDVADAIRVGEYFAKDEVAAGSENRIPARSAASIIFRILEASNPGPKATARLSRFDPV